MDVKPFYSIYTSFFLNCYNNFNSVILIIKGFISLFFCVAWKSKSEDCEKDIQEWQKEISAATTNISKLNRQIKSKVGVISGYFLVFHA